MRVASINTFNLYGDPAEAERHAAVEDLIRGLDADIVAAQEIIARPPAQPGDPDQRAVAERRVRHLADAVGRRCEVDGTVALALGGGIHHTALLWREGIAPVPGTVGRFERDPAGMWHSLVTAVFDLGGPRLRVGSVQLSPFDQLWAWIDSAQVMRAMNSDTTPGLIAGDLNGIGASSDYDPDPYDRAAWHPHHAHQYDEHGQLDRRVARRLEGPARMRDCARIAAAPWAATTGHPDDPHPPRRIDRAYATHHLPDAAITSYGVASPAAFNCTDHLPIWVDLDTASLPGTISR